MTQSIQRDYGHGLHTTCYTYVRDKKGQAKQLNLGQDQIDTKTIGRMTLVLHRRPWRYRSGSLSEINCGFWDRVGESGCQS